MAQLTDTEIRAYLESKIDSVNYHLFYGLLLLTAPQLRAIVQMLVRGDITIDMIIELKAFTTESVDAFIFNYSTDPDDILVEGSIVQGYRILRQLGLTDKWLADPVVDTAIGKLAVDAVLYARTPKSVKVATLKHSYANTLDIGTDAKIHAIMGTASVTAAEQARALAEFKAFFAPLLALKWSDDVMDITYKMFNSKINGASHIGMLNTNLNFTQWLLSDTEPNVYARAYHKRVAYYGRSGDAEFRKYIVTLINKYKGNITVSADFIYQTYDQIELDVELIMRASELFDTTLTKVTGFDVIKQLNTHISTINSYRKRLKSLITSLHDYSVQQVSGKFGV